MLNISSLIAHSKFIRKKPFVIYKLVRGVFKKAILRRNVLRTVDLAITGDCHYRCSFCSAYLLYSKKKSYISISKIKEVLRESQRLGAMHLNLTGGEPLMRNFNEILEIIRSFNPKVNLISMVTNALNLTPEKLESLKKEGLDTLQISLESLEQSEHDNMVGINGSFDKVMQAVDYAISLNLNLCINVVVDRNNVSKIKDIVNFCKKKKAFCVLDTISSVGRLNGNESLKLLKEQRAIFDKLLKDPYIRHDSSMNFSLKMECPGGKERVHITAYGDVMTCPLVQVSYGNVNRESLNVIYKRFLQYLHIRKNTSSCKHAFDEEYYRLIVEPAMNTDNPPIFIEDLLGTKSS